MAFFMAFSASSLFCRAGIMWMLILATLSTYLASVEVCLSAFLYLFGSSVPQLQVTEELLICPLLLSPAAHGLLLFVGRLFWHFPASPPDPFVISLTMKHPWFWPQFYHGLVWLLTLQNYNQVIETSDELFYRFVWQLETFVELGVLYNHVFSHTKKTVKLCQNAVIFLSVFLPNIGWC